MVIVTTLKLLTPYERSFDTAEEAAEYLDDLGYWTLNDHGGVKSVAVGLKIIPAHVLLVGIPSEGRVHRIEFLHEINPEQFDHYLTEAGLK